MLVLLTKERIKMQEEKTFTVYVEIVATGKDKVSVQGAVEDFLDDMFGAENYTTYDVQELGDDEHDDTIPDDEAIHEMLGEETQKELDEADVLRDEQLSDELG